MPVIHDEDGESLPVWEYSPWRSFIRFRGPLDAADHAAKGPGRVLLTQMFREDVAQAPTDPEDVRDIFGRALELTRSKKSFASRADLSRTVKHFNNNKNATRVMAEDNHRWGTAGRLYVGARHQRKGSDDDSDSEDSDEDDEEEYEEAEESYAPLERNQGGALGQKSPQSGRFHADAVPVPRTPDTAAPTSLFATPGASQPPRLRAVANVVAAAARWRNTRSCPNLELPFPVPGAHPVPGVSSSNSTTTTTGQHATGGQQTPSTDARRNNPGAGGAEARPSRLQQVVDGSRSSSGQAPDWQGTAATQQHAASRLQQMTSGGGAAAAPNGTPAAPAGGGFQAGRALVRSNTLTTASLAVRKSDNGMGASAGTAAGAGTGAGADELAPVRRLRSMASMQNGCNAGTPMLSRANSLAPSKLLHAQAAAGASRRSADLPVTRTPVLQSSASMSRSHGGTLGGIGAGGDEGRFAGGGSGGAAVPLPPPQRDMATRRSLGPQSSRRLNVLVEDDQSETAVGGCGVATADCYSVQTSGASATSPPSVNSRSMLRAGSMSRSFRTADPASAASQQTVVSPGAQTRMSPSTPSNGWRADSRRITQSQTPGAGDGFSLPPATRITAVAERPATTQGMSSGKGVIGRLKGMFQ